MSRSRNLKPGFFKNETLAECQPLARILFEGLWCEADRAGRLEDRPRRLKAEYLPYDDCDAEELLAELALRHFILRYAIDGKQYIQVLAFEKHQNPHVKESASTIPAPDKSGASPVLECLEHEASHADSPSLIPDSPSQEKRVASQPRVPAIALPDWLSPQAWADWHTFRNSRKGWTQKARELSLATLTKLRRKGHDPTAVIEQSIERGWTGLFEIKGETQNGNGRQSGKASLVERMRIANADADERDSRGTIEGDFRLTGTA